MARRRQAWFDDQPEPDPERLIFIDESGASTKMARLRGRARRGERCRAAGPHGHWKTTTFVGALRLRGMTAPMVLDGPMNGPAFLAYVEQVLAPTLAAGETVIMDNLDSVRQAGVKCGVVEVAIGQAAIVVISLGTASMVGVVSSAMASVCI